jgi:hypothetical protein
MVSKTKTTLFLVLLIAFSSIAFAQKVLSLKPYDGTAASGLIAQIKADTLANKGILADRVYELTGGQVYLATEIFNVASKYTVKMRGVAGGAKPIIYLYPTGTGATPQRPPGNLFVLLGGSLELSNLAVAGYFEPVDTNFNNVQGGLINTTAAGSSIILDNVLLTQINGQHVRTGSAAKTVKVTNSIFSNMGALSTSNFGAGKALDLREVAIDSLILVNNTFVNYQDRVVRHYNFSNPLAGTGGIKYTLIDHNSFVNGMGFHGLLSLGNVGKEVIIRNNLFMDAFAVGEDSTDATRSVEWGNTGEKYPNGRFRMMWIFTAPNDTTKWTVKNNFYSISSAGQAFFDAHKKEPITEGKPLSAHINKRLGADSTKAFTKVSLTMTKVPKLMTNMMEWYLSPTGGNKTKNTPTSAWVRALHDMDRRPYKYFIDTMKADYSTAVAAYSGAEKGFPAGDLNWFPSRKAAWITAGGTAIRKTEELPVAYSLDQNYPNPFNPTTNISFNIPKEGFTRLNVYNILGQKIISLVNENLKAGNYVYSFDASKLSSGVYLYRLESNNFSQTRKMLLTK